MNEPAASGNPLICEQCGSTIAPGLLICPGCHALVHSQQLKTLAAEAEKKVQEGKTLEGLDLWRQAAALLPPESQQFETIAGKIAALSATLDKTPAAIGHPEGRWKWLAGWGAFGVILWKFKFLVVILLTKGKLLLLGLTKASTFFSMFATFGVYWNIYGWKFALGLVLSIYVHEMGHVFALKRFGIAATAPMFIPGVGAFIGLKQMHLSPMEEARVGLAGPLWGLFAAVFCYAVFMLTGWASWGAIAHVGAWINLFNLLPFVPLDGGRGFFGLNRVQKWIAVAAVAVMWFLTAEGLLVLLAIVGIVNALGPAKTGKPDHRALLEYVMLVIVLSVLCKIPVPVGEIMP